MTVPTYAMGLALVVAIGYFAYNAFFGEDEQQQGHQNRGRGEQYRNQQDEQEARHRRQRGEVRQRRQREDDSRSGRRPIPVKPTKQVCERNSCSNLPSALCTFCNIHLCSNCNRSRDSCSECGRRAIQEFSDTCTCCGEQIFDCYLTQCQHIYHERCLRQWYDSNPTNPTCIYCREPFNLNQISRNFQAHYLALL